jgi:cysteine-rich repeat protein
LAALLSVGCGDDAGPQPADADSGTSSGDEADGPAADTDTDTSTEPAHDCGNGIVEIGEDCDDTNTVEADGCLSDCTVPLQLAWSRTYGGNGSDLASAGVFDDAGNLYIVGGSEGAAQDQDLWLVQIAPDGSEVFSWTRDGTAGGNDLGHAIAWHPSGDLILTGVATDADTLTVVRFSLSTMAPVWVDEGSPGTAQGVAVDLDGNVFVAGAAADNILLQSYDADGNVRWTQTHDEGGGVDVARSVTTDAAGNVYLAGSVASGPTGATNQGWIRKYDAGGNALWTGTEPATTFGDVAMGIDDTLVVSGSREGIGGEAADAWVGVYDLDLHPVGSATYTVGTWEYGNGLATGESGSVYLGASLDLLAPPTPWVARYDADLSVRWWDETWTGAPAGKRDRAEGLALSPDESRVALIGRRGASPPDGSVGDAWVAVYAKAGG